MKIQRLDITGFKSFADRTSIRFGQGITGVVGPNGCGKSNIVDAIREVAGLPERDKTGQEVPA